ncbi:DUF86 domain-containing protein [Gorillibacterium massiliense]|uniref:DUF86 domain-containing protein n=1 Tax=Gorillibacterium massiliense TaxID=1280390 RepID=UPI0004B994FB|nr:HepT-like ribonuclease domain-containing protein [Gorillibacterium massiliense]
MYYIDRNQVEDRLSYVNELSALCRELMNRWTDGDSVLHFAQERALHTAIETVTDVGSLLIDGFLLRDAAGYEDIVGILTGEQALDTETSAYLMELVKLRKPLVQQFYRLERQGMHPLLRTLPEHMESFARSVREFMEKELTRSGQA